LHFARKTEILREFIKSGGDDDMTTYFVCGRCGKARKREEVVIVSASEYGVDDGFVAIRCKEHKNALSAARRAAWRHARRVKERRRGQEVM